MADSTTKLPEGPKGVTTVDDNMRFDVERLSYRSAACLAEQIAKEAGPHVKGQVCVIAGMQLLRDLANLQASYIRLEALEMEFARLAAPADDVVEKVLAGTRAFNLPSMTAKAESLAAVAAAVASIASPASALVSTALGVVGLFRQDTAYQGQQVTIDPIAFELCVADALGKVNASRVFVPDLAFFPEPSDGTGSLKARILAVERAKGAAWNTVAPLVREATELEARLERATQAKDEPTAADLTDQLAHLRRNLEPVSTSFGRAEQRLNDLLSQWNQVDEASGLSTLARLMRAEVVNRMKPVYVHAAICASGGYKRTTVHIWRLIGFGDGLTCSGGAVARWGVFAHSGAIIRGGILECTQKE